MFASRLVPHRVAIECWKQSSVLQGAFIQSIIHNVTRTLNFIYEGREIPYSMRTVHVERRTLETHNCESLVNWYQFRVQLSYQQNADVWGIIA